MLTLARANSVCPCSLLTHWPNVRQGAADIPTFTVFIIFYTCEMLALHKDFTTETLVCSIGTTHQETLLEKYHKTVAGGFLFLFWLD